MNILHVSQNYYPSVGGPQYSMKHISEKLVEYYGDKVEVCTSDSLYAPESRLYKRAEPGFELINGVEVNRLSFRRWHYPLITNTGKVVGKLFNKQLPLSVSKRRYGLDSPAMEKMMEKSGADVIMATTILYNFADYPLWRFKTANPKPFVLYGAIHLHVDLPYNSPTLVRARACDCYIANTDYEKLKLIEYGVDENKIVSIGTGIALEDYDVDQGMVHKFRKENDIQENDVVIGYIGRLVKGKGVPVLIDAFRKISAENKRVKLLLAGGTTEYVSEIKKIIEQERLPIILIEHFPDSMKGLLYNAIDVLVLASRSESFGVVILEAWACNKPVIATRMGAIESLMSEGKDGYLFAPNNADDLAIKLEALVENKLLRNELGKNGYMKVEDNYTWPKIVAKYRDAYLRGIENFNAQFRFSKNLRTKAAL